MTTPRHAYWREDALVIGAWQATIGPPPAQSEEEIRARAACSHQTAFRVWTIRRAATLPVIEMWLAGDLTLRQLERCFTNHPFDEAKQVEEAAATSPSVRRRMQRTG